MVKIREQVEREGQAAADAGERTTANPYEFDTDEWRAWLDGWEFAEYGHYGAAEEGWNAYMASLQCPYPDGSREARRWGWGRGAAEATRSPYCGKCSREGLLTE